MRLAYARTVSELPRRYVMVATSNRDDVLNDTTGNRRWVPIIVGTGIGLLNMIPRVRENRDQLWAEALALYRSGRRAYLSDELKDEATESAERHVYIPNEMLHDAVGMLAKSEMTMKEIRAALLGAGIENVARMKDAEIRQELKRRKWYSKKVRRATGTANVWINPSADEEFE